MDAYLPSSRRPIAAAFRRTAAFAVRLCLRWGIRADAVSYSSMVFAALGGVCFYLSGRYFWLLAVAPLFCYVRLWLNMLDGMVAIAGGTASLRGELLNDLPDRISDVIIFAGVAQSGLCAVQSGYAAAIMAILTAYVGMMGQALGGRRQFRGAMSKPWRMVALQIGAYVALGLHLAGRPPWPGPTVLDYTCFIIIGGCLQTIFVRLRHIMADLRHKNAPVRMRATPGEARPMD